MVKVLGCGNFKVEVGVPSSVSLYSFVKKRNVFVVHTEGRFSIRTCTMKKKTGIRTLWKKDVMAHGGLNDNIC